MKSNDDHYTKLRKIIKKPPTTTALIYTERKGNYEGNLISVMPAVVALWFYESTDNSAE